jgi:DNA-binding LytR/AlgR family response regulator
MADYVKIYLCDGDTVLTLLTTKKILAMLPQQKFIRVHKSYIVPVEINSVYNKMVDVNGISLPRR